MRFVVDENIPAKTVRTMRSAGHDVLDWRQSAGRGAPDEHILATALREDRIVLTTDAGFGRTTAAVGVLLVRLKQPSRERIHRAAIRGLKKLEERSDWTGRVVVAGERGVFARRLMRA
ncbi:MAG: DUF5615 family PIN-like protein [Terriglobales bacterium]